MPQSPSLQIRPAQTLQLLLTGHSFQLLHVLCYPLDAFNDPDIFCPRAAHSAQGEAAPTLEKSKMYEYCCVSNFYFLLFSFHYYMKSISICAQLWTDRCLWFMYRQVFMYLVALALSGRPRVRLDQYSVCNAGAL